MQDSSGEHRVAVVIEDDDDIRHLLETVLRQAGFEVVSRNNGLDGVEAVKRHAPVVTTIDINMPGIDGFETARRIRAFSDAYIVMLTALGEEIDTLQGLDAGADDYITKPFRPRELRARIDAMLRRPRSGAPSSGPATAPAASAPAASPSLIQSDAPSAWGAGTANPMPVSPTPQPTPPQQPAQPAWTEPVAAQPSQYAPPTASYAAAPQATPPEHTMPRADVPAVSAADREAEGWLEHNRLRVHPDMRLVEVDGADVTVTRSEFDLLLALMQSGRRVRTKADLALMLRGESYVTTHFVSDADKRGIEVHMGNLRKKLAESSTSPRWIETVRGVGYRLTAPDA